MKAALLLALMVAASALLAVAAAERPSPSFQAAGLACAPCHVGP